MSKRRNRNLTQKTEKPACPKCGHKIVNLRRGVRKGDLKAYGHGAGDWIKGCQMCGEVLTQHNEVVLPIRFVVDLDDGELIAMAQFADVTPWFMRQAKRAAEKAAKEAIEEANNSETNIKCDCGADCCEHAYTTDDNPTDA